VADILSHNPHTIGFGRILTESKWARWIHLVLRLMDIQLSEHKDVFVWNLTSRVRILKSHFLAYE
jgi:hypothetical protein